MIVHLPTAMFIDTGSMYSLVPRPFPEVISQPWKKPVLHDCEIKSESGLGMRLVHAHTGIL